MSAFFMVKKEVDVISDGTIIIDTSIDNSGAEEGLKGLNNKLNSIIPNLVRQFGLKDGIAVAKDSTGSSYTTGYTDPVTGERYEDIYDYYMATNARYSDVASVKDRYGNVESFVTIAGNAPI